MSTRRNILIPELKNKKFIQEGIQIATLGSLVLLVYGVIVDPWLKFLTLFSSGLIFMSGAFRILFAYDKKPNKFNIQFAHKALFAGMVIFLFIIILLTLAAWQQVVTPFTSPPS